MSGHTVLVLPGGGAKGAFQVGVLQVLKEKGYTFKAISGVSVGALNGALIATNQFDTLVEVWNRLEPSRVMKKRSLLNLASQFAKYKAGIGKPPVAMNNNGPLRKLMEQHLIGKNAKLPFHFGYVKLNTGEYVNAIIRRTGNHTIDQADIDRLISSTAIPIMFNPTMINDMMWVDGGVRNISPISEVLPHQPDKIVIIPTDPLHGSDRHTKLRDIIDIAYKTLEILLDEIFKEDIERFLTINELVRQAEDQGAVLKKSNGSSYKYIEPLIIAPKRGLGNALDFDNKKLKEMINIGRKRALEMVG